MQRMSNEVTVKNGPEMELFRSDRSYYDRDHAC
jgi:hypothetical protein